MASEVSAHGSSSQVFRALPDNPTDIESNLPPLKKPPLSPCMEGFANQCQRLEDCLAITGLAVVIGGLAYGIFEQNEVYVVLFGFLAICFGAVVIFNKTCGNLPRINRQFVQSVAREGQLEERELAIIKKYQTQIVKYQGCTTEVKKLVESLTQSVTQSYAATERMKKSLFDAKGQFDEAEQINGELKLILEQAKDLDQSSKLQLQELSKKLSALHGEVEKASSAADELKKIETVIEHSATEREKTSAELRAELEEAKQQEQKTAALYQRLLAQSQTFQTEFDQIKESLQAAKGTNQQLSTENLQLKASLEELSSQLEKANQKMEAEMKAVEERQAFVAKKKAELDRLQRAVQESAAPPPSLVELQQRLEQNTEVTRSRIEQLRESFK